jgi:hypothetical protein
VTPICARNITASFFSSKSYRAIHLISVAVSFCRSIPDQGFARSEGGSHVRFHP